MKRCYTDKAPFWSRNQHVNTIVGAVFATPPKPTYEVSRLADVHTCEAAEFTRKAVIA